VGFPESVLTSDEHVEMHLHPHWKVMVWPVLVAVVLVAAVVAAAITLPSKASGNVLLLVVGGAALILFCWLTVWPFLNWRNKHYVFTNERVIMREGVFSRDGRDIPMDRVNDVSFHHNFFQRMLGCGTLVIESAGERGQVTLNDIPHVEKNQSRLYSLVEANHNAHSFGDDDRAALTKEIAHDREGTS
jgi:uncharacterized membrane protein YdbT with pleckstrin-like domain